VSVKLAAAKDQSSQIASKNPDSMLIVGSVCLSPSRADCLLKLGRLFAQPGNNSSGGQGNRRPKTRNLR
jgi:hypothetical protein